MNSVTGDGLGTRPCSRRPTPYEGSAVGLDADQVVDRVSKTLLTAKIPLGRLDGHVAQQELNLVQFPAGIAAQAGTSPSEVVRGKPQ